MERLLDERDFSMKRICFVLVFALVSVLAAAMLVPSSAKAADRIAHSVDASGNETSYYDIESAVKAGYSGKTIVMDGDWNVSDVGGTLDIDDDESITIDMCGHQIKGNGEDTVIDVDDDASLTLTSSVKQDIWFEGYYELNRKAWYKAYTGGLVINGYDSGGAGGINMEDDCVVTLDGVSVCGNKAENTLFTKSSSGGVYIDGDGSTLNLKNGATIERNASDIGGGVYVDEDDTTINLEGSVIKDNYADDYGGGLYLCGKATVKLEKGSQIGWNKAAVGGGIYVENSAYTIISPDKTGQVLYNEAFGEMNLEERDSHYGGGALYATLDMFGSDDLLQGISFIGNKALYNGGALDLWQKGLSIVDCSFTDNEAGWNGGAVHDKKGEISISNSTLKGNKCSTGTSGSYNGGAIFVDSLFNLKLTGKCVIQGNINKVDNSADDVFLQEGIVSTAYVTGGVSKDSKVGIRVEADGDHRIGDSIKNETDSSFFIDKEGYYVSYGTDNNGDMWQRKADMKYALTVNGKALGRFRQGESVSVNGASSDSSKVFRCWSYDESSGLAPFSENVSNIYDPQLWFKMPQNDVVLNAEFMDRQKSAAILLEKPEAGKLLNTTGEIQWEGKVAGSKAIGISWYEKDGDSLTPATSVAKPGVTYVAKASIAQDAEMGLAFAFDMDSVRASMDGGQTGTNVDSYSVDEAGTLSVSISCAVDKDTAKSIEPASVTVAEGITEEALKAALPDQALVYTYSGAYVNAQTKKDAVDFAGLIEDGEVVKPEDGKITLSIPVESDTVYFPESLNAVKVEVTVVDAPVEDIATPKLSPEGGTYSTSDADTQIVDGKLKVAASCDTERVTIKYKLSHLEGGEWVDDAEGSFKDDGVSLAICEGEQRNYRLEVWATKGKSESIHDTQYYLIDDVQPVEKVKLTVSYADTASSEHHADWAGGEDEYAIERGQDYSIAAPTHEGYVFEKWVNAEGEVVGTDNTYTFKELDADTKITCVYNPVVTELDLGLQLPELHRALATEADYVKAKIGTSTDSEDVSDYFKKDGKLVLSWQPAGDSEGKAEHLTCYLASLSLAGQSQDDVKYVLSSKLVTKVNGGAVEGKAYVAEQDGISSLFVSCPSTGPYEYASLADLDDLELSFRQALACNAGQESGEEESWDLPKSVRVTYKCGETELLDIDWGKVEGFDKDATGEQTLTATGKVKYPSYVDNDGAPETVSVKLKVAAPEKVQAPEASLAPGTYKEAQEVELGCSTEGAVVRYTTDGSEPNEDSQAYEGEPIKVVANTTIKAKAFAEGMIESDLAEFTYVVDGASPEPSPAPDSGDEGGAAVDDDSVDDDGSDTSAASDDTDDKTESARTGDAAPLPAVLAVTALAGITALAVRRRACE